MNLYIAVKRLLDRQVYQFTEKASEGNCLEKAANICLRLPYAQPLILIIGQRQEWQPLARLRASDQSVVLSWFSVGLQSLNEMVCVDYRPKRVMLAGSDTSDATSVLSVSLHRDRQSHKWCATKHSCDGSRLAAYLTSINMLHFCQSIENGIMWPIKEMSDIS